ncbi:unnamed protein product [Danaus chrysippus]|uniref:(African queen) hypothetical protein n=1 Tax=Danaus chrysippus TaxID=151541 RepID=A0A8J2R1P6_9NEOP|nr:unnamed protein product [Danaus chrysippus]
MKGHEISTCKRREYNNARAQGFQNSPRVNFVELPQEEVGYDEVDEGHKQGNQPQTRTLSNSLSHEQGNQPQTLAHPKGHEQGNQSQTRTLSNSLSHEQGNQPQTLAHSKSSNQGYQPQTLNHSKEVYEVHIDTTKRLLPHVLLESQASDIPLSLLVDSGSAICLIKESSIRSNQKLIKEPIKLKDEDLMDLLVSPPSFNPDELTADIQDPCEYDTAELAQSSDPIIEPTLPTDPPSKDPIDLLVPPNDFNPDDLIITSQDQGEPVRTESQNTPNLIVEPGPPTDDPLNLNLPDDDYPTFLKIIAVLATVVYSVTRGEPQRNYVQPITSSSGLYYDYLGNLKINNVQLQVVIPVDISHFKPHIKNIENTLETSKYLCKQTRIEQIDQECHNLLQPISARFQDMSKEFSAISHLLDNRSKRSAWIGVIGTAMKHIFGSLDENDGMRYNEAITTLQNDEKRLATLMKENILVTSSTLKIHNDSLFKIRENENNLVVAIDKLSLSIKNITELTNGLQILINVNEVFNAIETAIITLSFQLEDVTNAIMFSSQNVLHPSVITPKQLYQELVDNYRHLSNDLELPVALNIDSIHLILSISKTVCFYIRDKIVFVLEVPLVNTKEYVLFHNIAIPTPHNPKEPNSFTLIIPENKYIAMTIDKSHYCVFNDLGACKSVGTGNFICDLQNVYSTDAKPICETIKICCIKLNNRPFQYFKKKQAVTLTTPEIKETIDRTEIDTEISSPVAPLRTRI